MIRLERLAVSRGTFRLSEVSFEVPARAYGVVIGPAGSGKTTLLEAIAGVAPAESGTVIVDGSDVTHRAPNERGVGLVYQHAYLFPHLSVRANVAYGAKGTSLVEDLIARFGLGDLLDRAVTALSGGERQLVALARAFAHRPRVVLLDEPFGALDPRRRSEIRRIVRQLHREWHLTLLQVTHDFTEAGLLGDVAVLIDRGRVLQWGSPAEVFRRPASAYIAEFLGAENVYAGIAHVLDSKAAEPSAPSEGRTRSIEFATGPLTIAAVGQAASGPCYAVIRAEEVVLSREPRHTSARNNFEGVVEEIAVLGASSRVTLDVMGVPLVAMLTTPSADELGLKPGERVYASFKAFAVHLC